MKKKLTLTITAFVLVILILSAVKFSSTAETGPGQATASGFSNTDELVITLVPEKHVFAQKKRYHYITDYLSKKLNIVVRAEILPDYGAICKAFLEGKADVGFFGSFSYGLVHAKASVEPLARPVWLNGSSTYSGYLFVSKDSGIKTVADMKGKRLALVHKATTAGYIFALDYFRSHGVDNLDEYFSKVHFCGSHDSAAWAVYSGEAEIGACKNHIFNALAEKESDFKDKMVILAESNKVPSNGMAVRKSLDPFLKKRLKEVLINMHKTNDGIEALKGFKAKRFIETTDLDYIPLYRMVEDIGIDLRTYVSD
jgi:phosphonate transport system substrate-binding protein